MAAVVDEKMARLRWSCRRGMRELDICLKHFLNREYPQLSAQQQQDFETLLSFQDQDLFNWIMGNAQPVEAELREMIALIKRSAASAP